MGDDQPRPGICVFQATFSVADQRSGRLALVDNAREPGPRNCGQTASEAEVTRGFSPASRIATIIRRAWFVFIFVVCREFLGNNASQLNRAVINSVTAARLVVEGRQRSVGSGQRRVPGPG